MRGSDAKPGKARSTAPGAAPCIPTLTAAANDPSILGGLPFHVLLDLKRAHEHLGAELDAAILQALQPSAERGDPLAVLDVKTAAERLGTSRDSLYRKHQRLRLGYIDPLDGRLKFTESEITAYIRRQSRG